MLWCRFWCSERALRRAARCRTCAQSRRAKIQECVHTYPAAAINLTRRARGADTWYIVIQCKHDSVAVSQPRLATPLTNACQSACMASRRVNVVNAHVDRAYGQCMMRRSRSLHMQRGNADDRASPVCESGDLASYSLCDVGAYNVDRGLSIGAA